MRFPSLMRRSETAPPAEEGTGAQTPATGAPGSTDRGGDPATYRSASAALASGRARAAGSTGGSGSEGGGGSTGGSDTARTLEQPRTEPDTLEQPLTAGPAATGTATAPVRTAERERSAARRPLPPPPPGTPENRDTPPPAADPRTEPEAAPPAPVGPKARSSLLATLGLVLGVAGLLGVLTGTLAGYGIGVGALGAVVSVFGLVATRRRRVAGKPDALLGIAFGLGAVVVGVLAMTGLYTWPTTDGDWVQRLREWLDSQFVDRF